MTIEIKVSGNDAAETVAQFLGLASYLNGGNTVAVSAPVPVVQVAPAPVAADEDDNGADVADGTVDAEGLPFDDRIHAKAAQPFKADGTWKRRKNISDDLYNTVRAELKARLAPTATVAPAPAPAVTVAQPEVVATVVEQVAPTATVAPAPAPVVEQPAPTATVAPAPAAQAAPAPATGKTHAELQGCLTKTLHALGSALPVGEAPKILMSLLASYGVAGMPQVPADKVDEVYNRMQRMQADPANAATIAVGLA